MTRSEQMLSACDKGMPGGMAPIARSAIANQHWNVLREDLPLPVALLKQSALHHNSRWMRDFLARTGTRIAPHGKTSMSPQLFDLQIDNGAWAITVSTPHQIHVARAFGYPRVVLANQLIGRASIGYVLDELQRDAGFDFYCLVDSQEAVARLAEVAAQRAIGRPLKVLLEGGYIGGRTGCRTFEACMEVARAVRAAHPHLTLAGVEGFEGLIKEASQEATEARVQAFLQFLGDVARQCDAEGLFTEEQVLMSAGGSDFYDMVTHAFSALQLGRPTLNLTRSGCYLTHDSVMYAKTDPLVHQRNPELAQMGPGLRPAIEVWAYVQSRPEPGLVIATMGKRDVGVDHLPVLERWFRPGGTMPEPLAAPPQHQVVGLNDQHAKLSVPPDSPLAVGDMLGFGIGHPCLTFDKWRVMTVVDDRYDVVDAISTYF